VSSFCEQRWPAGAGTYEKNSLAIGDGDGTARVCRGLVWMVTKSGVVGINSGAGTLLKAVSPPLNTLIGGKVKPRAKDTKEIRIQMAIQAVQNPTPPASPLSIRRAAEKYGVSRSTVQTRMKGVKTRAESQARHQALTPDEEGEIVRWIEKSDDMAIPPRATHVIRMKRPTFTL
jgi:hypothetical protein